MSQGCYLLANPNDSALIAEYTMLDGTLFNLSYILTIKKGLSNLKLSSLSWMSKSKKPPSCLSVFSLPSSNSFV